MKNTMRYLKRLRITFTAGQKLHYGASTFIPFEEAAEKFKPRDFIVSAPELVSLSVSSHQIKPPGPLKLKAVVSDFTWSSLEIVIFNNMQCKEGTLIDFFRRHSSTLKYVALSSMRMDEGSWKETFHKMRRLLDLETCRLTGQFTGGGVGFWDLEAEDQLDQNTPGLVIGDYITATKLGDKTLDEYLEEIGSIW